MGGRVSGLVFPYWLPMNDSVLVRHGGWAPLRGLGGRRISGRGVVRAWVSALAFAGALVAIRAQTWLEFVPERAVVAENSGEVRLAVRRVGGLGHPLAVDYWTVNQTALAGRDYVATRGRLEYGPEDEVRAVVIPLRDNTRLDDDRFFTVQLGNAVSEVAFAWLPVGTVMVLDNENPGSLKGDFWPVGLDTGYAIQVMAAAAQPDGKIVVSGTRYDPGASSQTGFLARLRPDGALDWVARVGREGVEALAIQNDGSVLIGGHFSSVNGVARTNLARLRPDGSLDESFAPGVGSAPPGGRVMVLALTTDQRILVGGVFGELTGLPCTNLVRLRSDGGFDPEFVPPAIAGPPGSSSHVGALLVLADGGLLAGGRFGRVNGQQRSGLARFRADGTLDAAFAPEFNPAGSTIAALAAREDGRLVLGGDFTEVGGVARARLARLLPDGRPDEGFLPGGGPNGEVRAIVALSGGRTLVGGAFDAFAGIPRRGLAWLDARGVVEPGFLPGLAWATPPSIATLVVEAGGTVLAGGSWDPPSLGLVRLMGDTATELGFEFVAATFESSEAAGEVTVRIRRNGPAAAATSLWLATHDASALAGEDYLAEDRLVEFAAGETVRALSLRLLDDPTVENEETFEVRLHRPLPGAALGRQAVATVRIQDNETPVLTDPSFNPGLGLDDRVRAIVVQPDGRVVVGGDFNHANGVRRDEVARFNRDGSLDETFAPGPTLRGRFGLGVLAVAVQEDGGVLVGGDFHDTNEVRQAVMVRLNRDGSPDSSFQPFTSFQHRVRAIVVQPDGRILVGGSFSPGNVTQQNLVRLETNGVLDPTFALRSGAPNEELRGLALQPDGKILLAGYFTAIGAQPQGHIARLDASGALDPTFHAGTGTDHDTAAVTVQPDGKIVVVGDFTSFNGVLVSRIVRLNADGSWDATFRPDRGANREVHAVAVQADARVLIGGEFTEVNGVQRLRVARLHPDGSLDLDFNPGLGLNEEVRTLALVPEGVLVAGDFTLINGVGANRLARLFTQPAPAPLPAVSLVLGGYAAEENAGAATVTVRRHGDTRAAASVDYRVVPDTASAGDFVGGTGTLRFAPMETAQSISVGLRDDGQVEDIETFRIELSGVSAGLGMGPHAGATVGIIDDEQPVAFDSGFTAGLGAGSLVNALALQPDGRLLVGGQLELAGGTRVALARFKEDGAFDATFAPLAVGGSVRSIRVLSDNRIVIGGDFAGGPVNHLGRLEADGTIDPGFTPPNPNAEVRVVTATRDGKFLIGGAFTYLGATERRRIARLEANGVLDVGFDPASGANDQVLDIVEDPDGRVLVAGRFTRFGGQTRHYLARLEADGTLDPTFKASPNDRVRAVARLSDGRWLIAGRFTEVEGVPRTYLARLEADGTLDRTFRPAAVDEEVRSLVVLPDGRLVIAGEFTTVAGVARRRVARLTADGSLDHAFLPGAGFDATVWAAVVDAEGRLIAGGEPAWTGGAPLARLNVEPTRLTTLEFDAAGYAAEEGTGRVEVLIRRRGNLESGLRVEYATLAGTAEAGADFPPQTGAVEFGPAEASRTLVLAITDDRLAEPDEQFRLDLAAAAVGVPAPIPITVLDDDRPGSRDSAFEVGHDMINGGFQRVLALADGGVLAVNVRWPGGPTLVRLKPGASLDTDFDWPWFPPGATLEAMAEQPDGRLVVGGAFGAVNGLAQAALARLRPEGELDASFRPVFDGGTRSVKALVALPDGCLLAGGMFTRVDGVVRDRLVRLRSDGEVDLGFEVPGLPCGGLTAMAVDEAGGIVVGIGSGGECLTGTVVRLEADGAIDASFAIHQAVGAQPWAIAVQPDGRILVGETVDAGGVRTHSVLRLNRDGQRDAGFTPRLDGPVYWLVVQPDGRIVLGGGFLSVNGVPRVSIARLHPDGQTDLSLDAALLAPVLNGLAADAEGNLLALLCPGPAPGYECGYLARLRGDPPLWLEAEARWPEGTFELRANVLPSNAYAIEASANLVDWATVGTRRAETNLLKWVETDLVGMGQRFYRVRQVPR